MSADHHHPSRRGEPVRATPRVRHRTTGREGRLASDGTNGDLLVLFDGDAGPSSVRPRNLRYIDEPAGASASKA